MRIRKLSWIFCLTLLLAAGGCAGEQADGDNDGGMNEGEHVEEAAEGEDHHADPNDRDAWSKPAEVYAFLGIEPGDVVVDIMAGGGYHSVRLAEHVGPEGAVIAERGSDDLLVQVESGEAPSNIRIVGELTELDDASADVVLAVRAYHLFPDVPAILAEVNRVLAPGGVVGIVEVRLNEDHGHDMTTHRMGEQTVIEDMEAAGFEYVESSDILRRDDDDYTSFRAGERHMSDRMLLKFRKAE